MGDAGKIIKGSREGNGARGWGLSSCRIPRKEIPIPKGRAVALWGGFLGRPQPGITCFISAEEAPLAPGPSPLAATSPAHKIQGTLEQAVGTGLALTASWAHAAVCRPLLGDLHFMIFL